MNKHVVSHNSDWSRRFKTEATILWSALGKNVVALHHIGSTAVPDILAKPIIDILAEVVSLEEIDLRSSEMLKLGYSVMGEYGLKDRRYFKRTGRDNAPGFHVHAYQFGTYPVQRHLAFRDYLLAHTDEARAYSQLKTKLSDDSGLLCAEYQQRKSPFVKRVELRALEWFSSKR